MIEFENIPQDAAERIDELSERILETISDFAHENNALEVADILACLQGVYISIGLEEMGPQRMIDVLKASIEAIENDFEELSAANIER